MIKFLVFWVSLLGILISWELVLLDPSNILYWLFLCLVASGIASLRLSGGDGGFWSVLIDRISVVLFSIGVFWWLLWIDFEYIKFVVAALVWCVLVYGMRREKPHEHMSVTLRLILFFGGTFVWTVTSFGLFTVIGWKLIETLGVFIVSFSVFAYSGVHTIARNQKGLLTAYLVLMLLGIEFFSVVSWLPFTEATLALILTVLVLGSFDLIKYYIYPERIRKKIIIKKLLVYAFFLVVVLVSTSWV
ncbi:hypothetical protein BK004_01175 [bacterium CG10_46_32]|nr:MAG: hypothetical protein BK004_01175 [bacterium CG10_46_32]PIR56310.1 MAG: hypothetical protein COU73_01190 [Parcubacteria group bacterium CG10_big_fil_rev_8_21_14_0_10_46_32]